MRKPSSCEGCPFYQTGNGFVPDEVRPGAKILLIAQNPGETEEEQARPLVGRTGIMTLGWLEKLGVRRDECSLANVIKCRWNRTNSLPEGKDGRFAEITLAAARHCQQYLLPTLAQAEQNVVGLMGELALQSVAKRFGVSEWRGSVWVEKGRKYVSLLHPAHLFREPRMRTAILQDIARLVRESQKREKEIEYHDTFYKNVSPKEFIRLCDELGASTRRRVALDIETSYAKAAEASLKTIGIGWGEETAANIDFGGCDAAERAEVLAAIERFPGEFITATPFDYTVLTKYGVKFAWERCHDLTLLHSRFDIELPHTLDFIASMWTEREYWKYLNSQDPYRYNCLDCAATYEAFKKLWIHCATKDQEVLKCYEADRLLEKVCVEFQLNGLPFSLEAFKAEKAYYEVRREELASEVSASFASGPETVEHAAPPRCERHPRYSGKSPIGKRKGEDSPCGDCHHVREYYLSRQPLNLRSRTQLSRKLREAGMQVGESLAKGKVAALAKKYNDPRLMRFLEFKKQDTIVTRYFSDPTVTKRTGRIHSTYSMHAAKHRWSSNGPNAQQFLRPEE